MQFYNEKEQAGQKEMQTVQLEEKGGTRKLNVGHKAYAERD